MDTNNLDMDMFNDYSKILEISCNVALEALKIEEENAHLKRIIEILLTGKLYSKESKKVKELFEKCSTEELAIQVFQKCVMQGMNSLCVLEAMENQGLIKCG